MEVKTVKKPVFDPGLCRCCGTMKKCRLLNFEYENAGRKEIYSEMIMDCFGILLSLSGKPSERLVCATCVLRLRDALDFRRQVLRCEEAFLLMKMYDTEFADRQQPIAEATVQGAPLIEIEVVKTEPTEDDEESNGVDMCQDALADGPPSPDDADIKPKMHDSDTDDLPLSQHVNIMKSSSKLPELIEKREVEQQTGEEDRAEKKKERRDVKSKRLANLKPMTRASVISKMISKKHKVPMSQVQQLMRERDPAYMTETNILTIVEYSYVCPFKCRHNHLICYYCGEHFDDPTLLREHTLKAHHPKKFKVTEHKNMIKVDLTRIDCRLCATKIDDLEDFKRHISSVHKKKYYFEYKVDVPLGDIQDSVLPFKLTKEELKCALCDVLFPYFHALNKHMNEHFSNYVCETCGLGFVDKGRFVMHQQRHEVGDFPCETCGKIFKAEYNRDLHIDRVHNKRGRVYCPKCDVRLMSYPQKLKHLVEAHGEQPLSFSCSLCAKVCDTRRTLTIHWRKEHLKDFRYECKCCGQKFFTRFALTNHMPTHTGERNFKCKVCEKSYPRLKTLKDHMRIHTNDRRYRCHVCGQAFIQNCSLKGHMKSQHPEYG